MEPGKLVKILALSGNDPDFISFKKRSILS